MYRLNTTFRIAIALACLSVCVMLLAWAIGLITDPSEQVRQSRVALAETVAVNCSLSAAQDDLPHIEAFLELFVSRYPEVGLARLKNASDSVLVEVNQSDDGSGTVRQAAETMREIDILEVPLLVGENPWGVVEIGFFPPPGQGWLRQLANSTTVLVVFVACANILVFFWYLGRVLQHLNPSKVIPPRVRETLDTFAEGLLVLNQDQKIVLANQAFANTIGANADQLQGQDVGELPWVLADDQQSSKFPWSEALDNKQKRIGEFLTLKNPSSQHTKTFLVNASPVVDDQGGCHGVLASFDDVTEIQHRNSALRQMLKKLEQSRDHIQKQNQELRRLATRDSLTGCLNRRAFFEILDHQHSSATRYHYPLSCLMLDIDHFKSINDQHGHAVGDEVLKAVASILHKTLRDADILCRYGGEEFCVCLPQMDIDQAMSAADRLRTAIANAQLSKLQVTASFGVSSLRFGATDPLKLIQQADEALYGAKRSGRNRCVRWDEIPPSVEMDELSLCRVGNSLGEDAEAAVSFQAAHALFSALLFRHPRLAEHCRRVADLCVATAHDAMPPSELYALELAALLHETGKIGVPDTLLFTSGMASQEEQDLLALYEQIGDEVVKSIFGNSRLHGILKGARARFADDHDSKDGILGNRIPLGGRILRIADCFDMMQSTEASCEETAADQARMFARLRDAAGVEFDPGLVERFIRTVTERDHNRRETNDRGDRIEPVPNELSELSQLLDQRMFAEVQSLTERTRMLAARYGVTNSGTPTVAATLGSLS